MNRNKRSMTLDPMHETGRAIVRRLVATADVVVANLPPPTLAAMGLDYASLSAIKPDIILTSVSAFGSTGPYKDRVGFDGVGQAMSGSTYMTGTADEPRRSVTAFVDFGTALSAAFGTALALLDRARTGKGRVVEASLFRTALNFANGLLIEEAATGIGRVPSGNRSQSSAPADLFRASDGWILVQVVGDPLFRRIAKLIGAEDWLADERFASDMSRGDNGQAVSERVAAWCVQRTAAEALAELDRARVPCGPVYTPRQVLDDPHVRETGLLAPVPFPGMPSGGARVAQQIVTFADVSPSAFVRAPLLGEHTDAVLHELGYDDAEIASFEARGAI
jgi:crotonobetainyl-CoA:carnitine CoA-transferase CaiB-like acyl-CoA transferase